MGVNFDFEVKFDLEGQDQSLPKTIGILTKVFYIYGPNLVILAERGDELSRGQARDWRTDGHTDRQTQATTIPEGQNWPRVKTQVSFGPNVLHNYPIVDIMDEWDFARFDLSLRHTHTYHHIIPTPWIATQITPKGVYTIYHLINCGLETPYGNINMGQHCHCLSHCSHARESNFTKWFSCIFTWEQLQTNCFWPYYLTCVRRLYFKNYCHISESKPRKVIHGPLSLRGMVYIFHSPIVWNTYHTIGQSHSWLELLSLNEVGSSIYCQREPEWNKIDLNMFRLQNFQKYFNLNPIVIKTDFSSKCISVFRQSI